jgi:K(+)-stimulated pyrophosphate-energized sodium pump
MYTTTSAGARTAWAASRNLNSGLQVAFRGGAVMGFSVVGFTLLSISILFFSLYYLVPVSFFRGFEPLSEIATVMVSGVFGASAVALFARVGGGIYTKAADVGADLYESYMGSILATVILGVSAVIFRNGDTTQQLNYMSMPMVLAALGVLVSILGSGWCASTAKTTSKA